VTRESVFRPAHCVPGHLPERSKEEPVRLLFPRWSLFRHGCHPCDWCGRTRSTPPLAEYENLLSLEQHPSPPLMSNLGSGSGFHSNSKPMSGLWLLFLPIFSNNRWLEPICCLLHERPSYLFAHFFDRLLLRTGFLPEGFPYPVGHLPSCGPSPVPRFTCSYGLSALPNRRMLEHEVLVWSSSFICALFAQTSARSSFSEIPQAFYVFTFLALADFISYFP